MHGAAHWEDQIIELQDEVDSLRAEVRQLWREIRALRGAARSGEDQVGDSRSTSQSLDRQISIRPSTGYPETEPSPSLELRRSVPFAPLLHLQRDLLRALCQRGDCRGWNEKPSATRLADSSLAASAASTVVRAGEIAFRSRHACGSSRVTLLARSTRR